jgi:hypothetical protein
MAAALLALVIAMPLQARADDPRLTGVIVPVLPISRTNGPVPLKVTLNWAGGSLLNGTVEIQADEFRVRTAPVTVVQGPQTYLVTLPTLEGFGPLVLPELRLRFIPADPDAKPLELGAFPILAPNPTFRSLTMGIARPAGSRIPPAHAKLAEQLRLERFDPDAKSPNALCRTTAANVPCDEMGGSPLSYCAYDLLVLSHEGFAEMGPGSLEAIARWVEAGGSVCVVPGAGAMFRKHHADFLNRLAAGRRLYRAESDGRFSCEPPAKNLLLTAPGLGRAVIGLDPPIPEPSEHPEEWRDAAIWLWKIRADQAEAIRNSGIWQPRSGYEGFSMPYAVSDPFILSESSNALLPEQVDVLSPGLVLLILLLFVAAVGPGDYWLLGLLRRRGLTWVLFPAACVGLTAGIVVISNLTLGGARERRAVTIADVDERGAILRTNRLEMIFPSSARPESSDLEHAFFTPLDQDGHGLHGLYGWYMGWGINMPIKKTTTEAPLYEGDLPGRHRVTQQLQQWTPQLNRILSFEPPPNLPAIDWNGPIDSMAPGADIYEFDPARYPIRPDERISLQPIRAGKVGLPQSWISRLCVGHPWGPHFVVSQKSPNLDPNFGDLTLVDPSDPNSKLMIVVMKQGSDFVILRQLRRGGR